ncbi:MAG: DNA repair protein RecO [Candidatus Zixiibacteriota bacterium]
MALQKSEAVILKKFNWSESSRTVHFFTRDFGKLPLNDKGGRSFRSKRGRMVPFCRMEITFYKSEKETAGYIADSEILEAFAFEKDGSLGRLAYGSAGCELLYLLLPEGEAQVMLYNYFLSFLRVVDRCDKRGLSALFITFFLKTLSQLGYHPSLNYCVGCNREANGAEMKGANNGVTKFNGEMFFSPERGGIVCPSCQKPGEYYISLSADSHRLLAALQTASLNEAVSLPLGFTEAGQLLDLLAKFLNYQSGLNTSLKSLEFLDKLKNSQLAG